MNRPFSMFAIALLFSSFGCLGTPPGGEEVDQGGTLDAERPREDAGGRLSDVADDDNATDAEPSVTPPELPQDYVRSSRFERLRLVIDHADGITPRRAATDHVVGELGAALDKPGGVDVELRDVVETAGSGHVWTFEELTALADERFGPGYSKEAIEIGVLYLDGTYEDTMIVVCSDHGGRGKEQLLHSLKVIHLVSHF